MYKYEYFRQFDILRKHFDYLSGQNFPDSYTATYCHVVSKCLAAIVHGLKNSPDKLLRHLRQILLIFSDLAGTLENSKGDNIPWSGIPSLKAYFSKFLTNYGFIFSPTWDLSFSINMGCRIELIVVILELLEKNGLVAKDTNDEIRNIIDKFENNCSLPTKLHIINFPRLEKLCILNYPILGHELGHILAKQEIEENFWVQFKSDIEKELLSLITNSPDAKYIPELKDALNKDPGKTISSIIVNKWLGNWSNKFSDIMEETISDIIAVMIWGPSMIFSAQMFAFIGVDYDRLDMDSEYFPWRLRIQIMVDALTNCTYRIDAKYSKTNKYFEMIKKETNDVKVNDKFKDAIIENFKDEDKAILKKKSDFYLKVYRILIDKYKNNKEKIFEHLKTKLNSPIYQFNETRLRNINEVYNKLEHQITPNAVLNNDLIENEIPLVDIVEGTWLYCLEKYSDQSIHSFVELDLSNRLGLKAIELSYIQNLFNTKKNQVANDSNKRNN